MRKIGSILASFVTALTSVAVMIAMPASAASASLSGWTTLYPGYGQFGPVAACQYTSALHPGVVFINVKITEPADSPVVSANVVATHDDWQHYDWVSYKTDWTMNGTTKSQLHQGYIAQNAQAKLGVSVQTATAGYGVGSQMNPSALATCSTHTTIEPQPVRF